MLYTAWQLRALKGKTVEVTLQNWTTNKWVINVNAFYAVHLMGEWWTRAHLLVPAAYSNSDEADIINLKVIEDFTEWEEVYVSDESVEEAIKEKRNLIFICTSNSWKHIVQWNSWYQSQSDTGFSSYKYIVKIPQEEQVEEMTMEQVNKALGKKIKIIE